MDRKKVLFIAPPYMDLYKDVIAEIRNQNYDVDYLPEMSYNDDPYNVRGNRKYSKFLVNNYFFNKKINKIWSARLNTEEYHKSYDILFVLDGQSVRPIVFDILRKRNPQIKTVNYLFDTSTGVYEFWHNYPYFDKVFSFDRLEAKKYNISHLPIYWNPATEDNFVEKIDVLGLGAHNYLRYDLFKTIKNISNDLNLSYFLKLYVKPIRKSKWGEIVIRVKKAVLKGRRYDDIEKLDKDLLTTTFMSPKEFRNRIFRSKVVVDTSPAGQVGLTARFMWALGANTKIITTSCEVANYSFYNPSQVYIVRDIDKIDVSEVKDFLSAPVQMDSLQRQQIDGFRIDRWFKTIFHGL